MDSENKRFGEGDWALPGTLAFPRGDGPWSMVDQ